MAAGYLPERWRLRIGLTCILLALFALWFGHRRTHPVHAPADASDGRDETERISEWTLNDYSTFSGVESTPLRDRLVFSFDPEAPRAKSTCPT